MANHKSSKKRILRNETKRVENKSRTSRIRTFIKKVEAMVSTGDKTKSQEALSKANSEIAKGVKNGTIKKNTAARKVSQLAKKVKSV